LGKDSRHDLVALRFWSVPLPRFEGFTRIFNALRALEASDFGSGDFECDASFVRLAVSVCAMGFAACFGQADKLSDLSQ